MQRAVQIWRRQQQDKALLGQIGVILSWTEISVASPRFESQLPYSVVLVELENGQRVYGQLVDFMPDERRIGAAVRAIFRRVGDVGPEDIIEYGVKFKPLASSNAS